MLEGRTFLLSDALGDVPAGSVGGLVHDDTRFLNRWEVRLEGQPLSLKSRAVDYYSAAFYLTNPEIEGLHPNTIAVRRFRFVGNGLLEQLAAVNAGLETARFELRLTGRADFADLFEMKSVVRDRSETISREHGADGQSMRFSYEVPGFQAACTVRVVRSGISTRPRSRSSPTPRCESTATASSGSSRSRQGSSSEPSCGSSSS